MSQVQVKALYQDGKKWIISVTVEKIGEKVNVFHNDVLVQRYSVDSEDRIHRKYCDYDPVTGQKLTIISYHHGLKHGPSYIKRIVGGETTNIKKIYSNGELMTKTTKVGNITTINYNNGKSMKVIRNEDGTINNVGEYRGLSRNGMIKYPINNDGLMYYELYSKNELIESGYCS